MDPDLKTYAWVEIFHMPEVHQQVSDRENVHKIISMSQPDHPKPIQGWCTEDHCTQTYLALFQLHSGMFVAIRAPCDTTPIRGKARCKKSYDADLLISQFFNEEERARMNQSIARDRIVNVTPTRR
jgi:hypothetical protein